MFPLCLNLVAFTMLGDRRNFLSILFLLFLEHRGAWVIQGVLAVFLELFFTSVEHQFLAKGFVLILHMLLLIHLRTWSFVSGTKGALLLAIWYSWATGELCAKEK